MGKSRYENKAWTDKMRVSFDYSNMMESAVGKAHGISEDELAEYDSKSLEIDRELKEKRDNGLLPFYDLPYKQEETQKILDLAEDIRGNFDAFVGIGIGGSALGNIALQTALRHPYYNQLDKDKRGGPQVYFFDNIDPDRLSALFEMIDLKKTVFNVISKSGETAETMSSFLIIKEKLIEAVGEKEHGKHIVVTTDKAKGILRPICEKEGYKSLVVPDGVGGRFSVLTPVGLLSAAVAGIDISELLAGAANMDKRLTEASVSSNIAYKNALLHYIMAKKGKNISVMMPYSNALSEFAAWYAQLWAESLGKRKSTNGDDIFVGQTPVKAVGATDQHSQIQLYIEGPFDKVITLLKVENTENKQEIPKTVEYPELKYLESQSMKKLFDSEMEATSIALTDNNRVNCTFVVPEVNPFTFGQLIYLYEVQTAFSGGLYGIDAFNQPGVEAGKKATYALMGRKGFEEKRKEIEESKSTKRRYILS